MKKVILGAVIIISLVIINNLARSIYNLWQKQELVTTTEKELSREKKIHEDLKAQARTVKDPDYIEKIARNKLFLAKPKEEVVILPEQVAGAKTEDIKAKKLVKIPNWKAWLATFSFDASN
jgi:cell division protein FtsB